jgi:hypothetical protein
LRFVSSCFCRHLVGAVIEGSHYKFEGLQR